MNITRCRVSYFCSIWILSSENIYFESFQSSCHLHQWHRLQENQKSHWCNCDFSEKTRHTTAAQFTSAQFSSYSIRNHITSTMLNITICGAEFNVILPMVHANSHNCFCFPIVSITKSAVIATFHIYCSNSSLSSSRRIESNRIKNLFFKRAPTFKILSRSTETTIPTTTMNWRWRKKNCIVNWTEVPK